MKKLRLIACVALIGCTLSIAVRGSLAGQPPITQTFPIIVDNEAVGNCGSFHIIANGEGTVRETIYFHDDGSPFRLNVHATYRGTLTNSVTGFSIADDPSVVQIFVDFDRFTETRVGQFFNINVPGEGTVALEVGRFVIDPSGEIVFLKGQFEVSERGTAILCAALD